MTALLPETATVEGVDLHEGDTIVDPVDGETLHLIVVLVEYGPFFGDHARRAHGHGWHATILDHHHYRRIAA